MTGIGRPTCATPHGGFQFGHLAESTPLTCTEAGDQTMQTPTVTKSEGEEEGVKVELDSQA